MTIPNPNPDGSFILPKSRLTDRQCSAIGRVATTWSLVEFLMERTLAKLALAPSLLGYVLTDKLGPDNRISAIKSLVGVHRTKYAGQLVGPAVLDAIDTLLKSIERMKGERNYVVHSVWTKSDDEHIYQLNMAGAARSGATYTSGHADCISDIEEFCVTIQTVADRLCQLSSLIPETEGALLDKLRRQEQLNRRNPDAQLVRLSQRRSYTQLRPDFGPATDQSPKKKVQPSARRRSAKK